MNNDAIAKVIQQLSDKLGVTAQYLWGILLHQARVELISDCIFILFTILGCYLWIKWAIHISATITKVKQDKYYYDLSYWLDESIPRAVAFIVSGLAALLCTCIAIGTICIDMPTLIFNPAYWALKQLIH